MALKHCAACEGAIPDESAYCPICGFRQTRISADDHQRLTGQLAAVRAQAEASGEIVGHAVAAEAPAALAKSRSGELMGALTGDLGEPVPDRQRRAQRYPMRVDVDYNSEHNFYTGFLENIGSGGVFIATHTHAELGEELEVSFTVPGLEGTCVARCEVRWARDYNPATPEIPPGIGCCFRELHPEAEAAITLFIRHREPIFYE